MALITGSSTTLAGVASILNASAVGRFDPTTRWTSQGWWRATWTPKGPGTLHLHDGGRGIEAHGFGPGGAWLVERSAAICGAHDQTPVLQAHHRVVEQALRQAPLPIFGRTHTPYHDALPVVLGQRITTQEAHRQWRELCRRLGTPAPGPESGLLVPPSPRAILDRPTWWFHPLGIERSRADALRSIARHAKRLSDLDPAEPVQARRWMELLPGIGPWTSTTVAQISWGDPDSVIVGDYWLPHLVVRAFTGRARGSDSEMLELLEPWQGQRARVVRLLGAAGHRVERRGPGVKTLPMHRW